MGYRSKQTAWFWVVYLKEEIADILGLKAACRPLRVAVLGAQSIVTDSKNCTCSPRER